MPTIIGQGVATSVQTAFSAINPSSGDFVSTASEGATVMSKDGMYVAHAPSGATVTVYPADAQGRRKVVALAPNGAQTVTYADADEDIPVAVSAPFHKRDGAIENAIAMKTVGVTPEYVAGHARRCAGASRRGCRRPDRNEGYRGDSRLCSRSLCGRDWDFDAGDIAGARAVGVDGNFIREMRAAGFGTADLGDLTGARAVGVTGEYIRQMRLSGYDGDLDDYIRLKSVVGGNRPAPPSPPSAPPRPPGR